MYVKYPRTPHLPWSNPSKTDLVQDVKSFAFAGQRVVVTEKIDGENNTVYQDNVHARSIDGRRSSALGWMKSYAAGWQQYLTDDMRIVGENTFIPHAIQYDAPVYFYGISVWNGSFVWAWDATVEFFRQLDITPVPVIYDGLWDEKVVRNLPIDEEKQEGYVVRLADSFILKDFSKSVGKYVRKGHVWTPSA